MSTTVTLAKVSGLIENGGLEAAWSIRMTSLDNVSMKEDLVTKSTNGDVSASSPLRKLLDDCDKCRELTAVTAAELVLEAELASGTLIDPAALEVVVCNKVVLALTLVLVRELLLID